MLHKHWPLFAVLAIFSCGEADKKTEEEKQSVEFKPTAGEKKSMSYEFSCTSPSDTTDVTFLIDLGIDVKSAKAGEYNLYVSYDKICATGNKGKYKIDVCAGDTIPQPLMKTVTSVFSYLHAVYEMQFDDRMRKTNEKVVEADSSAGTVAAPIGKMQFFTVLPSGKVSVGDTWKEELDLSGANQKKAMLTYTLEKTEKNVAYISFKGTLTANGEGFGQEFTMTSELEGTIEADCKTGWTLLAERKEDVTLVSGGVKNQVTFTYRMKLK